MSKTTSVSNAFGLKGTTAVPQNLPPKKVLMDARKLLLAEAADQVISKAIRKALDDDDKDQGMMIKMLMDRMLPMGEFEARKDGSRSQVTITISGVGDAKIQGETIDSEEV